MSLQDSSAPSKKTVEAMKIALTKATAKQVDKPVALALWNSFRWQLQVLKPGDWMAVDQLISQYVAKAEAEAELADPQIRVAVIARLTEMRNRLSEFNVETEEEE